MLRIGSLALEGRVLLAPVAGYFDLPLRLVCRHCGGVAMAYTELLCPHGILQMNRQTRLLAATCEDDQPLGMQLYGRESHLLAEAARWAVDHGACLIDINMGCPADKVTKTCAGAKLLTMPALAVQIAEALIKAVGDQVPVTVKLRLGYEEDQRCAPELARRLIGAGIAAITIHGRTADQRFTGRVDLRGIGEVVEAVHDASSGAVPCIGNGDIRTPFDAQTMVDRTGCDGVMIGRGAFGAPWLLRDTEHLLRHGCLPEPLTLRQRLSVISGHFQLMRRLRDDRHALHIMRQRIAHYGKHLGPCAALRAAIRQLDEAEGFDVAVEQFVAEAGEAAEVAPVDWHDRAAQLAPLASQATATQRKASP
jgi:nifR3 family TIM-barrel protein